MDTSTPGAGAGPNGFTLLTDDDIYLFHEGSHVRLHERLGSHPMRAGGVDGTYFAVYAPNARAVSVVGSFNDWNRDAHPLAPHGTSGIWEGFLPGVGEGAEYKYHVVSHVHGYRADKADPFALRHETPPRTASVVAKLSHAWRDTDWMEARRARPAASSPMSIYEVHLGSWRRVPEEANRTLTYRELASQLPDYARELGFTHVELLPVMEHPFTGSWGYQGTGYFAPTSRYGSAEDFAFLVDALHGAGLGVILDWVPSHFPSDEHGLGYFDGTRLYEHADPRKGYQPDWQSLVFDYGRGEVRSFLLSSALFWLDRFHADGLRVDAVASMLYLDFSRKAGEWVPNVYGGRENLDAVAFLRRLNEEAHRFHPEVEIAAEESTDWPGVTRPTFLGGLGFDMKWDLGWMNDTLEYMELDPIHRKFHHHLLTFRRVYSYTENFLLPLSHDEVVHLKGSLLTKMPGDEWQRFANLRLLFAWMWAQPGKKLLFMGGEIGQWREWNHDASLDWHLLEFERHKGLQRWVRDLNGLHRSEKALHELDWDPAGFDWIDCHDSDHSVVALLRYPKEGGEAVAVALNFTPVPRPGYLLGVPWGGSWREIANSDAVEYGGSGVGNLGEVEANPGEVHGRPFHLRVSIPPLGALFLKGRAPEPEKTPETETETTEEGSGEGEAARKQADPIAGKPPSGEPEPGDEP